jgi:hypothetical protein
MREVAREAFRVDGRRRDHHLQVVLSRSVDQPLEVAEQEIDVEAALMRLVDDDGVVARKQRVGLRFGEQDAVGHQLDAGRLGNLLVEADLVADLGAQRRAQLLGDPLRDAGGGQAPRLRVPDQPAAPGAGIAQPAASLQAQLGQLRRLARAGFARNDHDRMAADGVDDRLAMRRNRQRVDQAAQFGRYGSARGLARGAVRTSGFAQIADSLVGGGDRRVHDKIIMTGT